jgi:F-box/leucine-rich repeat protein 2/20
MFSNLKEFSIQNNYKITNEGLIDFAKNCSNLLKLNIQDCENISQNCIIEITKIFKNLNSFAFGFFESQYNINNEYFTTMFNNCKNLKSLNISYSNLTVFYFNETSLQSLIFNNLTELSFHFCDLTNENIIEFSKYCSNLQVFIVKHIKKITDKSIIEITKNCKNLNKLNISSCENIKENGFESIALNCKNLKFLYIDYNKYINESIITKIIENCLQLKKINIYRCSKISKEFMLKIKQKCFFINFYY